jgi:signal transduction histidine kinase
MDDLQSLESRFDETLEREKLEALAEFAAGAGHEINNPLTVIAGRAELLLKDETDPERRRSLALIAAQAMRVYEMIADMMLFARPPRPELQPVELVALVDGLIAEIAPAAERHETLIRRTGDPGPFHLEADPVQLAVALRALCQNALEAIGHGGQIEIELQGDCPSFRGHHAQHGRENGTVPFSAEDNRDDKPVTDCVTISVRDDGPGITPAERQHIFDPFYSARQAGRGLGLGLSKCWRIVTNHGGRIDVASQPGRGAAFTIVLPVQQGQR